MYFNCMIKFFTWINKRIKSHIFAESGVSTDIWTSYTARLMVISIIPYLIVQIPQLLNSTSGRHLALLIGLIVSLLLLVSYCLFQVSVPINMLLICCLVIQFYIQKILLIKFVKSFGNFFLLIVLDVFKRLL